MTDHGSDISSYPTVDTPGTGESIAKGTPVAKGTYNLAEDIIAAINGDDRLKSAAAIPMDIKMLAMEGLLAMRDPIYALANAGLSIVIELVQPFEDVIEMVSGDPDEMGRQQEVWGQVGSALEALSGETSSAVGNGLKGWSGQDAALANDQLSALGAAILAASHEAHSVKTLLGWAKALAEAIFMVIKSILAELVSWLITRGLMALANSTWSFGASVAAFILTASVKSFQMFNRVMNKFMQASKIFKAIAGPMMKFLGKSSFRGLTEYKLWKAVLTKAGIGLLGGLGTATSTAKDSVMGGPSGTPSLPGGGGGGGAITVDLDEFEGMAAALEGLSKNASGISDIAQQTAGAELVWGLPGTFGFESAYNESCQGLVEAIGEIEGAYNGNAMRLRSCGEAYKSTEEANAANLNKYLTKFA
ncbi:hypothetical protein AB0I28_19110 [Phytomonospora sp. NPDC050363]|uniref:hypothetical protein n=1 Tax=Phytomonospora sp. NPDC050363 TaxID=3155642 RepID=UPI0033CC6CC7